MTTQEKTLVELGFVRLRGKWVYSGAVANDNSKPKAA